jgi:SAM-dependent methyltransferase
VTARRRAIAARTAEQALVTALDRRVRSEGSISFPAAPSLLEHYLDRLSALFAAMGKAFSQGELASLRGFLEPRLKAGFEKSPHARIHVRWEPEAAPGTGVDYKIWLEDGSLEAEYAHWAAAEGPPPFGANADAKLLEVAAEHGKSARQRVLDVGAGTGRNALALARLGFKVDALELTPAFCDSLRAAAAVNGLPIKVIQSSVFAPKLRLGSAKYSLVICSEVTSHFRSFADLRAFFERVATWLCPGGSLLVNAFLADADFEPTRSGRELSQVAWSTLFTRPELARATRGLGLALFSEDSVYDFERAHQPSESWPPTSWFESWSQGFNCYRMPRGSAPMQLCWLHYRKRAPKRA